MILSKFEFHMPVLPERLVKALPIIAGVALTVVSLRLYNKYQDSQRTRKHKTYPRGVVILHQFPHGHKCPSASPFSLKLETWLRMADIKYTNEITLYDRSANGKIPWITLNGVEVGDSQACIEYLVKLYSKDLSSHLNIIDRSIARAFRKLTEESLRWSVLLHRYRYGKSEDVGGMPAWLYFFSAKKFLQKAYLHGCGRLSKEEIYDIGINDLRALETYLGEKKFFFGNRICEEDAAIFAMVCQVLYHDKGPLNEYLTKSCPNLLKYTETIKDDYWPDWNQRLI